MIPINLIRQYHFCPRIVYFSLLTNIKPIYPRHVSLGVDYHKLQEKLSKNRRFIKLHISYNEILQEKYIEDEKLDICGKVDLAFISDNEVIPCEFKNIASKPSHSHILQLYGYGILLQNEYNKKLSQGFIFHSNNLKLNHIQFNKKIKKDFFKTINNIKQIVSTNILPNSSANENKCGQCEYLNFCDDRI